MKAEEKENIEQRARKMLEILMSKINFSVINAMPF
jgi:hypothetical protein